MATTLNALWPAITNGAAARSAARTSAGSVIAVSILHMIMERATYDQYGAIALLTPAFLATVAWRTWRLSRGWAIAGTVYFALGGVLALAAAPQTGAVSLPPVLMIFALLTGVRAASAARRFNHASASEHAVRPDVAVFGSHGPS